MKNLLHLVIAGLIAAALGLPALAQDEPKAKPGAKSKAKAKAKAKAKPAAKAEAPPASPPAASQPESRTDVLNDRQRRGAEADQKDRARGTGASSGATSSTPSAPSGVDTTR